MKTRRASMDVLWNGAAVSTRLAQYRMSATYTDPASGEGDSLELSLQNEGEEWSNAWMPQKGDTLSASIVLTDWDGPGDNRTLSCGSFTLDSFSFSGFPNTVTVQALSTPADGGFAGTKRDKIWEQITVQAIGREIANRAGIAFVWDVSAAPLVLATVEQKSQTDAAFYQTLCEDYGYCLKVYANKLVVYDREEKKRLPSAAVIPREAVLRYDWETTLTGTYTGGQYTYTDPVTEENVTATVGGGARLLVESGQAASQADAQWKLTAAIARANHGATKANLSIPGNAALAASQCIDLVGLGKLSGKYYIDSITHNIGGGYTMDLELSLVSTMTETVLHDAIDRLARIGVMDSPGYWKEHVHDLLYLDSLILNLSAIIRQNQGGSSVTTADQAITILTAKGAINSPDYWRANATALQWLDALLIKAANALTPD